MKITTNVAATEYDVAAAVAEYQKLFDESENRPQFTPKEIAEVYPGLDTDRGRVALLRVGNMSGTPRGKHLVKVIARVNKLRSIKAGAGTWEEMANTFPGSSEEQLQQYFIDMMLLWCLPASSALAEESLQAVVGEVAAPEVAEVFELGPTASEQELDDIGRQANNRIALLNRKYSDFMPAWAEDEITDLEYVSSAIEIMFIFQDQRYYDLWDEIELGFDIRDISARADLIQDLLRAYITKKVQW